MAKIAKIVSGGHRSRDRWTRCRHLLRTPSRWLNDAFLQLGFTPAHPALGDLTPGTDGFDERRQNFFKLVEPIRTLAKGLGWSPVKGAYADLWLQDSPTRSVHTVRVAVLNNLLTIKVVPSASEYLEALQDLLSAHVDCDSSLVTLERDACQRPDGAAISISVSVPVVELLAGRATVEEIGEALFAHVSKYIAIITDDK